MVKYETQTFKWKWDVWRKGSFSFWEAFFGGYISIGPITIFGANAMNWVVNIKSKKYGYVCFTLPFLARWKKHRYSDSYVYTWYWYCSPDGTPGFSTFYIGNSHKEHEQAIIRKRLFGHNWKGDKNRKINDVIRNYSDWTWVFEHYTPKEVKTKWENFYKENK